MEKYTCKKWIKDFFENIVDGFYDLWKWLGIWKKVVWLIISEIAAYLNNRIFSLSTLWRGFLYTIITYLGIAILYSLFIRPFKENSKKESIILILRDDKKIENIIKNLNNQRVTGVELRNEGEIILHESQIDPWWDNHLDWRRKTKELISLLDINKAIQWNTLDMYRPRRSFPNAISSNHRKKLQMFDEWLDRLDKFITEFSS